MRLPAGQFNRRATIRKRTDQPTMDNALVENYEVGQEVFAKVTPVGNAIFFGTQQVGNDVTHHIAVRRQSTITEDQVTGDHVIDCDGMRYRVKRASDWLGERHTVMIEVELLGVIPA